MKALLLFTIVLTEIWLSHQHGYLIDPPARSSAWLVDEEFYECCQEFNHNQMFCGGKIHQWQENGGKCSICGEAWDEPNKKFEKGGEKYLGYVLREYKTNSIMDVTVEITANHLGHFEFRICKIDGWAGDATQECMDRTILDIANSTQFKFPIKETFSTVNLQLQLPSNLKCDHCVFQWKYVAGNDWGKSKDKANSIEECTGCGNAQEHFFGCADIAIRDNIIPTTRWKSSTKKIKTTSVGLTCERKLEFGLYLNFNSIADTFCEKICGLECGILMEQVEENLRNHIPNSPDDLITCLDTCPKLCDCS